MRGFLNLPKERTLIDGVLARGCRLGDVWVVLASLGCKS